MSSLFSLRSRWVMPIGSDEMWPVIDELLTSHDPMAWWPSVQVTSYDGKVIDVVARSQLAYSLVFTFSDLEFDRPKHLKFNARGDLEGRGVVTVVGIDENLCHLDIDWSVETTKAWMRRTSWLLRPAFVLGHRLVMRQGERHLACWVSARR